MKFNIKAKCKKCDNKTFKIEKVAESKSKHRLILNETLCHDGFGYDLNTFKIICVKCGSVNEDIFDVSKIKSGEKMDKINKLKVHFSSQRCDWKTPKSLLKQLTEEFGKMFDPCPSNPKFDGLKISWKKRNFVNPPYGREIGKWIEKGYLESKQGKLVVFLIPSRTDTIWWHKFIMKSDDIRFIEGRLKFSEYSNSAPFPSAIIIFGGKNAKR